MSKIFYINRKTANIYNAGHKAPEDIAAICKRAGYTEFIMPAFPKEKGNVYQKVWLLTVCARHWRKLERLVGAKDVIIYQHPTYGARVADRMIPNIQKSKKATFVAVIHDLDSLRKSVGEVFVVKEKTGKILDYDLLKHMDVLICHNTHMKEYLVEQGFRAERLICLEIFDYLCDFTDRNRVKGERPSIAIAGNLAKGKCDYIYEILGKEDKNLNLTLHLYGSNFDESCKRKNIIYHGSYEPAELPQYLEGDFGLVWDGTSAATCAGNTGEYLKYNNPHKASLYLAAGMPVIVWSQAAIADFVLENGVGIAVESLYELDKVISNITDEEYSAMRKRVTEIGEKIRSGFYFTSALKKCLNIIK